MPEEFNNQKILENNKLTRFILLILLPTFIVLIIVGSAALYNYTKKELLPMEDRGVYLVIGLFL